MLVTDARRWLSDLQNTDHCFESKFSRVQLFRLSFYNDFYILRINRRYITFIRNSTFMKSITNMWS
jgi:hypothetical protein